MMTRSKTRSGLRFWTALLTCLTALLALAAPALAQPAFTQPSPFDGAGTICSPTVMNLESDPGAAAPSTQTWYVQSDSSGTLRVMVAAVAVNPTETGTLTAELLAPGTGAVMQSVTLTYPAMGEAPAVLIASGTAPGQVYAVRLTATPPAEGPAAHHYRLRLDGASLAGVDPLLRQFEHDTVRWFLAVNPGEALDLQVTPGPIAPSSRMTVWLYDPAGNLTPGFPLNLTEPAPGAGITRGISIPGAAPGLWSALIDTDGHYLLDRPSGADRGIYLTWASYGKANLHVQITTPDGLPYNGPARVRVTAMAGGPVGPTESFVGNGEFFAGGMPVGAYRVEAFVDDPGAQITPAMQDLRLTCDATGAARFVVTTAAPPPPPPVEIGKVTAGNLQMKDGTGRKTAGFVIQADSATDAPKGQFEFHDHGLKWNFHSESYTGLGINPEMTEAIFAGTGTLGGVSGYTFRVRVQDLGEPGGRGDSFSITIWDSAGQVIYSYDSGLTGGNVQIHK